MLVTNKTVPGRTIHSQLIILFLVFDVTVGLYSEFNKVLINLFVLFEGLTIVSTNAVEQC